MLLPPQTHPPSSFHLCPPTSPPLSHLDAPRWSDHDVSETIGVCTLKHAGSSFSSCVSDTCLQFETVHEKDLQEKRHNTYGDEQKEILLDFGLAKLRKSYIHICEDGLEYDKVVGNWFIRTFSDSGSFIDAVKTFYKLSDPDIFSWYELLKAFLDNGQEIKVIRTYYHMYDSGLMLDGHVFRVVLKACANVKTLIDGMIIHVHMIENGIDCNIFSGSILLDMYVKCGNIEDARSVFEDLPEHDLVTWSTLLAGYVSHGLGQEALELFSCMQNVGIRPSEITFISVLKACSSMISLSQGQSSHAYIVCSGFETNIYLVNTLIDMYATCGSFDDARIAFAKLPSKDVSTWNVMIGGCECLEDVLHLFYQMQAQGMNPELLTFINVLRACANHAAPHEGMLVHAGAIKLDFESDVYIGSILVDMYAGSGYINDARAVFDKLPNTNAVTYTAIIAGYAQCGLATEAFLLFKNMQEVGMDIDQGVILSLLKSCTDISMLNQGYIVHALAVEFNFEIDVVVGTSLITMYLTIDGDINDSFVLFNRLPIRNTMTWNALISGLTSTPHEHVHASKALSIFQEMSESSVEPDIVTFISILKVCSILSALNHGSLIHSLIVGNGLQSNLLVGNALLNMYIKCGNLSNAFVVFYSLPVRDSVTFNVMIEGLSKSGHTKQALLLFERMQENDMNVNGVTFISLLSACSQNGLVKEGCYYFKLMKWVYGITPEIDHYNLMVDLMGRAGFLREAEDFLYSMPCQSDVPGWMSLLTNCKKYADVNLGWQCFTIVTSLDPCSASAYVLMANIYANLNMWEDAARLEETRKCTAGAVKKPGKAYIEIGHKMHEFTVGESSHPEINAVHAKLNDLVLRMKSNGYKPRLDLMNQSISEQEREAALCGHAEKLAIAFGLINSDAGITIRVSKNLRVCSDCHAATKVISLIEQREIVIKDAHCIHRFNEGYCSCRDFL